MTHSVVVVDDEPLAVDRVVRALERHDDFEVVGTASDAPEAARVLERLEPDVLFIDLRMPGGDGLQVVADIPVDRRPLVVFVTAFDDRAVEAFRLHAVDYLVKPFDAERFDETIEELRRRGGEDASERMEALLRELAPNRAWAKRVRVKEEDRVHFVPVEEIRYLESDGNHVVLHLAEGTEHRIRSTLTALHEQLDPSVFVRVHRSTVLSLDHLKEVQPWFSGDYLAILTDGRELRVSRRYREDLMRPAF